MLLVDVLPMLTGGGLVPTDSNLAELSELDSGEMSLLGQSWNSIARERRLYIVQRLVELAGSDVSLNFHRVLRYCLIDPDSEIRREAIRGLWECEQPSLIESLINLLKNDTSEAVQLEAALALGRFALLAEYGVINSEQGSRVAHTLLDVSKDCSRSIEVRQQALEAVASMSLPEVKTAIEDAYSSKDDRLRISSLRAMGISCDPSWMTILLKELGSNDSDMRREAVEALGRIEKENSVPQLAELIYDRDIEVQLATIIALGSIGGAEATECLKQCLKDPNEIISQAAEDVLKEMTGNDDISSFLL